ncbi:MAG: TIGR00282 family metallophosphoesterase [Planctomycetota bacterium]|jgi:metallophosphoesterase (TIGR00282 family)
MQIKILCVGDVVGNAGRQVLRTGLEHWRQQEKIDCTVVNAENTAGGSGLTASLHEKLRRYGVDLITMGDHIYRRRDIFPILDTSGMIVRPANYPEGAPGKDFAICDTASGHRVAVISVMGRMFMKPPVNCPFAAVDRVLGGLPSDIRIVIVDVHAEATSEKVAMGWHLDGRVSVVFGTHTHVPTADEQILPQGTAYITDVGMTGPYDSVLGRDRHRVLSAMRTGVPTTFDVAEGRPQMNGILVTVETTTGKATDVTRVRFEGTPNNETT